MSVTRRHFLRTSAAASALAAIGDLASVSEVVAGTAKEKWVKSVCRYCGTGCGLYQSTISPFERRRNMGLH